MRLDRRDILAWLADIYPVILVSYDEANDCGYWLSIQEYFADVHAFAKLSGKTVTVSIPTDNVLSADAMPAPRSQGCDLLRDCEELKQCLELLCRGDEFRIPCDRGVARVGCIHRGTQY